MLDKFKVTRSAEGRANRRGGKGREGNAKVSYQGSELSSKALEVSSEGSELRSEATESILLGDLYYFLDRMHDLCSKS